jgi:hypothetical protein
MNDPTHTLPDGPYVGEAEGYGSAGQGSMKSPARLQRSPYNTIFPRCAAIVHHGGAGTTQCSLMAGCPSVIVAHLADQFVTSWPCLTNAAAKAVKGEISPSLPHACNPIRIL